MCDQLKENGKCCGECSRATGERIRCEICDELRPAEEVEKDWKSPGWSVCDTCKDDGEADMMLAEHLSEHAVLDDCKYIINQYIEIGKTLNRLIKKGL